MDARSPATIMVVEDDEASRDALSRRLERRGYRIVLAVDGHEAVSKGPLGVTGSDSDGPRAARPRRL
jgi:ActR/RegA family two-component response regulator